MIFDVPLFQYYFFECMRRNFAKFHGGATLSISTTVNPLSKTFENLVSDPVSYSKYIQSTFIVSVNKHKFYFCFRNSYNHVDRCYDHPSSLEVLDFEADELTILKYHYFAPHSDAILVNKNNPYYSNLDDMKKDISFLTLYISNDFISVLDKGGIL